jgi:hypothetical protein
MLPFPLLHHLIPFPCRLGLFHRVAPHLASTYLSFPLNDRIYSDLANSPCYTLASRAAQHFLFLLWDSSVPSCPIDHQTIVPILSLSPSRSSLFTVLSDPENLPLLVFCNRGRHRVGLFSALLRREEGWSLSVVFEEYRRFFSPVEGADRIGGGEGSGGKAGRVGDLEWIEAFDLSGMQDGEELARMHGGG